MSVSRGGEKARLPNPLNDLQKAYSAIPEDCMLIIFQFVGFEVDSKNHRYDVITPKFWNRIFMIDPKLRLVSKEWENFYERVYKTVILSSNTLKTDARALTRDAKEFERLSADYTERSDHFRTTVKTLEEMVPIILPIQVEECKKMLNDQMNKGDQFKIFAIENLLMEPRTLPQIKGVYLQIGKFYVERAIHFHTLYTKSKRQAEEKKKWAEALPEKFLFKKISDIVFNPDSPRYHIFERLMKCYEGRDLEHFLSVLRNKHLVIPEAMVRGNIKMMQLVFDSVQGKNIIVERTTFLSIAIEFGCLKDVSKCLIDNGYVFEVLDAVRGLERAYKRAKEELPSAIEVIDYLIDESKEFDEFGDEEPGVDWDDILSRAEGYSCHKKLVQELEKRVEERSPFLPADFSSLSVSSWSLKLNSPSQVMTSPILKPEALSSSCTASI